MRFPPALRPIAALVAATTNVPAEPDLAPVQRWIEHQAAVHSVRADFVQERQLRSVKRPLVNPGRFSFADGSYRWELGEPAQTIAVQRAGEGLLVLRPTKREARRFTPEQLAADGAARGFAFLDAGFPRSYEGFARDFTVTDVAREGASHVFTAKLNDRRAAVALRKIVFTIDAESLELQSVYLRFRDGSSIATRFENVRENAAVDPALFEVDLTGYAMESDS